MRRSVGVWIAVAAMAVLMSGCGGGSTGDNGDSEVYQVLYSAFLRDLRASQINMASVDGVSYAVKCEGFYSGDLLVGNVGTENKADYVRACVDAHQSVFGNDQNG